MTISLQLDNVTLSQRLTNVSVDVSAGNFVHLLGTNGAGKSSLLSVISGLIEPVQGKVAINGTAIKDFTLSQLSQFRAYLEQSVQTTFSLTVQESLAFYQSFSILPNQLESALEVSAFLSRPMNTLSGGERQRVHIARTLMPVWQVMENGSGLVLFDEPFQGLDFKHQHLLCGLLKTLAHKGNLVIVSQHDLNLCEQYADYVWLMKNGKLQAADKTVAVLEEKKLREVFDCRINITSDSCGLRYFSTSPI